jgi:hypothetical protein
LAKNEILIKSKKRVQQHGEVFTPKNIVDAMVTLPGLDEQILLPTTTVLEPSVGEGAFLSNILQRRLNALAEQYPNDLGRIENYGLLAISSLYGVELLEDNVKKCAINVYTVFHDFYLENCEKLNKEPKENVLESAKTIVSINIVQGDFLKRFRADGSPIVFSEWQPVKLNARTKNISVIRTEYSLDDIYRKVKRTAGTQFTSEPIHSQPSLFDAVPVEDTESTQTPGTNFVYIPCPIVDVYKQEMEEAEL